MIKVYEKQNNPVFLEKIKTKHLGYLQVKPSVGEHVLIKGKNYKIIYIEHTESDTYVIVVRAAKSLVEKLGILG